MKVGETKLPLSGAKRKLQTCLPRESVNPFHNTPVHVNTPKQTLSESKEEKKYRSLGLGIS